MLRDRDVLFGHVVTLISSRFTNFYVHQNRNVLNRWNFFSHDPSNLLKFLSCFQRWQKGSGSNVKSYASFLFGFSFYQLKGTTLKNRSREVIRCVWVSVFFFSFCPHFFGVTFNHRFPFQSLTHGYLAFAIHYWFKQDVKTLKQWQRFAQRDANNSFRDEIKNCLF